MVAGSVVVFFCLVYTATYSAATLVHASLCVCIAHAVMGMLKQGMLQQYMLQQAMLQNLFRISSACGFFTAASTTTSSFA